mmetsp:Transcript_29761/g.47430  ORF Transcript_29761/g.47430 Transcript_29761/m.47430 type:complete len:239 (+) Transcript_29761:66-782(+)
MCAQIVIDHSSLIDQLHFVHVLKVSNRVIDVGTKRLCVFRLVSRTRGIPHIQLRVSLSRFRLVVIPYDLFCGEPIARLSRCDILAPFLLLQMVHDARDSHVRVEWPWIRQHRVIGGGEVVRNEVEILRRDPVIVDHRRQIPRLVLVEDIAVCHLIASGDQRGHRVERGICVVDIIAARGVADGARVDQVLVDCAAQTVEGDRHARIGVVGWIVFGVDVVFESYVSGSGRGAAGEQNRV